MVVPVGASGKFPRLGFVENMEISRLAGGGDSNDTHQFMSHRPAWQPGAQLPWDTVDTSRHETATYFVTRACGGHVYVQAPLAAARVIEDDDNAAKEVPNRGKFGIHVSTSFALEGCKSKDCNARQYKVCSQTWDTWTGLLSTRFRNSRLAVTFKPVSSLPANQRSLQPILQVPIQNQIQNCPLVLSALAARSHSSGLYRALRICS